MHQIDEGLSVSMSGPEAEGYVRAALAQIGEWGIVMPDTPPLVLDFGLGDFQNVGEIEFWIANEEAAGYCGKFLFMNTAQTCPRHMHRDKLETFFIVRGAIEMTYDKRSFTMEAGATLRAERGKEHRFTAREPSLILEVSQPSVIADNYFEDTRIPIGGNYQPSV